MQNIKKACLFQPYMHSATALLEKLRAYPSFSTNDFAKLVGGKPTYPKIFLHRLVKRKLVKRIMRGRYTTQEDPLTFASTLLPPSYLALWSALKFHNMTEQIPRGYFVLTPRKRAVMMFENEAIRINSTRLFWGFGKTTYKGFTVFVSDPEKTLIDCICSSAVSAGAVVDAMHLREINEDKLVNYAMRTASPTLAKRIGFLMEKAGLNAVKLRNIVDYNYVPLEPKGPKTGTKNKAWHLIENTKV